MPEDWHDGGPPWVRGRSMDRGGRPHWWPEDQEWNPSDPAWRRHRRSFLIRASLFLIVIGVLATIACAAIFGAIGFGAGYFHPPGEQEWGPPAWVVFRPLGAFFIIGVLAAGAAFISFALRRVANPVGRWLEAAGRVEAGDYEVRIDESGPREIQSVARAFNQMTARLQKDEEERRRLLADITHELRTPLTVVQGQLEGIIDGVYTADQERLERILDETKVLARLIEDLRTLSLAEHGRLPLHRETTDLTILVAESVAAFRHTAEDSGVTLTSNVDGDIPLLDVDPVRIREVLGNLIANALRYTPGGGRIIVELCAVPAHVTLTVKDNGRGIPPDILPHIFDRFVKTEESRGSGLGLAIVKNLVTLHGGEIVAESAPETGTTMTVTLPVV